MKHRLKNHTCSKLHCCNDIHEGWGRAPGALLKCDKRCLTALPKPWNELSAIVGLAPKAKMSDCKGSFCEISKGDGMLTFAKKAWSLEASSAMSIDDRAASNIAAHGNKL